MVTEWIDSLLSIVLMKLFHITWVVLHVVHMNQRKLFKDKVGFIVGPESNIVDKAVNLPPAIGVYLTRKQQRLETPLYKHVQDVQRVIVIGPEHMLRPAGETLSEMDKENEVRENSPIIIVRWTVLSLCTWSAIVSILVNLLPDSGPSLASIGWSVRAAVGLVKMVDYS